MGLYVFYSYSHRDEVYKDELQTQLKLLKRNRLIDDWDDRRIAPGDSWEKEISKNLQKADIVLLLVSADFLASDYCYEKETSFALEQHKANKCVVIPIIVRPCLFTQSNFIHLQVLPKDAKAVSLWDDTDLAWLNVAEGILKTVGEINNKTINN